MDLGTITIKCDHEGCAATLNTRTSSPHRARDTAHREGWSTRLTRSAFSLSVEFCPEHAAEHEAETIDGRGF